MAKKVMKADGSASNIALCKVLASLIKKGRKTMEDIPPELKDTVERFLNENDD